jgi:Uma2 family endonuclease
MADTPKLDMPTIDDTKIDGSKAKPLFVEYPETDGQPMTESDATRTYLIYCVAALRLFFQSRPQVYVSGNLFIYYQEGEPAKNFSPDVFVIFGVSKRPRRSYKVWQERGKIPSFVLEITSLTTKKQDETTKPELYARLGVEEYFQYDPTGDYLNPQLKGRRLVNGQYEPIPAETLLDGSISLHSQTLGLDLRLLPLAPLASFGDLGIVARELRLFDPKTNLRLLTYEEAEQARQEAEQAQQEAEQARQEAEQAQQEAEQARQEAEQAMELERQRAELAEQQVAKLLEQLRSQGIEPPQL